MRSVLLLSLCALVLSCSGQKKDPGRRRPSLPVRTLQVDPSTFLRVLSLTGEVYAPRTVTLSANVEGAVVCCFWREGDQVTATQDVFTIDPSIYQREVDIARQGYYVAAARHADAQAGFRPEEVRKFEQEVIAAREKLDFVTKDRDRARKLVEAGSFSREVLEKAEVEFVAARSRLETAQNQLKIGQEGATRTQLAVSHASELEANARLQLARSKFSETRIPAPFAGTITRVLARPGDNAAPRMPLLELADLSSMVIRFSVPERQSASIRLKQKILVTLDAFPGRELSGEVNRVHPTLDPKTRVLWVEAFITEEVRLIPGMFARIRLVLDEIPNQLVVPEAAVVTKQGERFVFTVEEGKARRRAVRVGFLAGGKAQILSGLEPKSRVIMENADQFRDGQDVEIIPDSGPGGRTEAPMPGSAEKKPEAAKKE
ncbi:efflux RND transporter periplasmic adaptor subunit [Myxococcota bacterium]|nr:efflux RND transporter periplasmic adaptor subunit [Myxococcota bacterium]MBU1410017.1 efflux RND transporter periplasmic adaptor subunit [Myxococcota bacterium]MBU1509368.1 efflux RND transporter periplasmic adaptor subunit [Myxococcota bacterium]